MILGTHARRNEPKKANSNKLNKKYRKTSGWLENAKKSLHF